MANRNFASGGKIYTMHVSPVIADCQILIGGTGAVTSTTSNLVSSVTRTGTGLYTVNLSDPYSSVLQVIGSATSPVSGLSGVLAVETGNAPNTNIASLTAPSIAIKTLDAAGALVDPASGSTINVVMYLSNSKVTAGSAI